MNLNSSSRSRGFVAALACLAVFNVGRAQPSAVPADPNTAVSPANLTTQQDHRLMMERLGIQSLRPGANPNNPNAANAVNYDEAKANPYPNLPDPLVLKNGERVTSAAMWWRQRRPEIVEDFDREIYGRVPTNVPPVKWEVTSTTRTNHGDVPVVTKQLVGRVDNSAYPAISVDIQLTLTTPANATAPVPVMMEFGFGGFGPGFRRGTNAPANTNAPRGGPFGGGAAGGPTWQAQVLAKGWGYAILVPTSIQADNGAGLTKGIIGLCNQGRPRQPEDWGALRAWAWGASRALDYFETDKSVDAKQVGIEGLSRYGKAALVAMAYDQRFAIGFIGSSGQGGAKLHRRTFGELVENLTGSGGYHWMAGDYLKYGGPLQAGDLPVDAHELIALCAPRPTFISYGAAEGPGAEGKWVDQRGSFMAAVAAGPVFRLLGKKDLGTSEFPAVETPLVDGELAWRQHAGGHTTGPNWPTFLAWADRYIKPAASRRAFLPADQPSPRSDRNSQLAHEQLLAKAKQGRIDVYFVGDSITRRWGATDYPEFLAHWNTNFFGWNAANFGWGADSTQNILWRLENGELDGVNPKVIVVMAGINNVGTQPGGPEKVADITRGVQAIVNVCQRKAPDATIILTGIFPRNDNMAVLPTINQINANLAQLADGKKLRYLNVNDRLADANGKLLEGMSKDKLHPTLKGYHVWAEGLKPILTEILGPPASTDQAPPPTGDPSAKTPNRPPPANQ